MTTQMAWVITSALVLLLVATASVAFVLHRRRQAEASGLPLSVGSSVPAETPEPTEPPAIESDNLASAEDDTTNEIESSKTVDENDEEEFVVKEMAAEAVTANELNEIDITESSDEHDKEPALAAEAFDVGRSSNIIRITIDDQTQVPHPQKRAQQQRTRVHHHHH
jgi:hypothetical protein